MTGLRALEEQHTARVGVFAHHLGTKKTVMHRADELFPMCSVFKTLAAAAVLRDLDRHGEVLYKVVHYTEADLVDGSDQTRAHLAEGTVRASGCCTTSVCRVTPCSGPASRRHSPPPSPRTPSSNGLCYDAVGPACANWSR
ncbi:serine hydrolase [Streptomyces prunicolor]|uniref:serine hydrolase n=1 Tax=Streptomyces prunicolor TaxID=67348 RepID=UPI003F4CAF80